MPDEQSNLNPSAPARRPTGHRRGRRGGRGRSRGRAPRPTAAKINPTADDMPTEPGAIPPQVDAPETETADTTGGFREPHPEEPVGAEGETFAAPETAEHVPEPAPERGQEPTRPPQPAESSRHEQHGRPERHERHEHRGHHEQQRRHEQPPQRPQQWTRPADFRPADGSAIHQAVLHATEIAEQLKHTIDALDEILELVELAERQKLADEREIEELRRALRRIQPPRFQSPPPQQQQRGPRREEYGRGHQGHHRPEPPPPPHSTPHAEESRAHAEPVRPAPPSETDIEPPANVNDPEED